ncbi:hypothetical protein D9756_008374 [Leucocoprinus leucothites]|uniref:Uncharacterized protein n=1 Tax=Leucocoprinus leucothites TaxID=201217 RepID=A0A8H5D1K1_9AGAR|nr:hypothetical protein D9756_008374 [Leucoagaricus leucothites]
MPRTRNQLLICAQFAFFLRTYALWNASRIIGALLAVVALGTVTAGIVIDTQLMRSTTLLQPPIQDKPAILPNCYLIVERQPELAMWSVVIIIIEDLLFMVLAIAAKFKMRYSLTTDSLVRKVYSDATYYFIINFLVSAMSLLLYKFLPGPLKQISGAFPSVMTRCLASHVILRLREHSTTEVTTAATGPSLGSLEFRHTELTDGRFETIILNSREPG